MFRSIHVMEPEPAREGITNEVESRLVHGPPIAPGRQSAADRLRVLARDHHAALYSYVLLLLRDREGTEDVLQETFVRAYTHLQHDRPLVRAWLYRVARNLALDELRRRKRSRARTERAQSDHLAPSPKSESSQVHRALDQLSDSDRELIYLADIDELSPREIAALYGLRAGAVRTRLCRAHVRFRAAYEEKQ